MLTRSDRRRSQARCEGCILQHIATAVQWKTEYELIRSTALTQPGGDAILYVEGGKVVHVVRSSSQYAMDIGISRPGTTQIIPGKVYVVSSSAKKKQRKGTENNGWTVKTSPRYLLTEPLLLIANGNAGPINRYLHGHLPTLSSPPEGVPQVTHQVVKVILILPLAITLGRSRP